VVSSTPRPHFTPGKDPLPIVQEAGWTPGPVWTGGKSRPHRVSIPDNPAILTELPGPLAKVIFRLKFGIKLLAHYRITYNDVSRSFIPNFNLSITLARLYEGFLMMVVCKNRSM